LQEGLPSRTAFGAAIHRAVHQILDDPRVFEDPLAVKMVGGHDTPALQASIGLEHAFARRRLRAFIAVRSQYAEDTLRSAVKQGLRQLVILGAGLDTFAYRNPHEGLRVFEVDHPATQTWKRSHLAALNIAVPPLLRFVGVDFQRQSLREGLVTAAFRLNEPALFSWLGVTPYLEQDVVIQTLGFLGATRLRLDQ
jgi:methyltransferase (TIGR00027 family)